jgi:hypothetical protein
MRTFALALAAAFAALPMAADTQQTATVTNASNATGCPAVVAAQSDVVLDYKAEYYSPKMAFVWSDGTRTAVPITLQSRSTPPKNVTYRARQSRLFTASTTGWFQVAIKLSNSPNETTTWRTPFTVTCRYPGTVVPGAVPHPSPVPPPSR